MTNTKPKKHIQGFNNALHKFFYYVAIEISLSNGRIHA